MMWVAGVAVAGAAVGLGWYGCAAPSSQWLGPSLVQGPADGKRGLRLVMWSDSGLDWRQGAEAIVGTAVKGLRPGAILLLHDGHGVRPAGEVDRSHTVKALPRIIDWVLSRGFSFVPLKDFLP